MASLSTLPRHANISLHGERGARVSAGVVEGGGGGAGGGKLGTLTGMPGSPEGPASPSSPAWPCTGRESRECPHGPSVQARALPLTPPNQDKEATYQFSLLALGPCSSREALHKSEVRAAEPAVEHTQRGPLPPCKPPLRDPGGTQGR